MDETYIKVKGQEKYLYRAVDSTGQTIDLLLTAKRDAAAAKRFFRKAFRSSCNPIPRVINVDKNPAGSGANSELGSDRVMAGVNFEDGFGQAEEREGVVCRAAL